METILKNLEADIEKVRQYLKELRETKNLSVTDRVFSITVYETMLDQLIAQRKEVKEYIEEAKK